MFRAMKTSLSLMTKREKFVFGVIVTSRSLLGLLDLLGVLLLGAIIATLITDISRTENRLRGLFPSDFGLPIEAFLLIAVSLVFLAKTAGGLFAIWKSEVFLSNLEVRIGRSVLNFYAEQGLPQISSQSPARFQWEVSSGPSILTTTILGSVIGLAAELTLVSLVVLALAFVDLSITLAVMIGTVLLVWLLQAFLYPHLERKARQQRDLLIESSNSLVNFMTMAREAIASGRATYLVDQTNRFRKRAAAARASQMFVASMPRYLLEISLILIVVSVLGFHVTSSAPEETLLTLGVFLVGGLRVAGAIMPIQSSLSTLRIAAAEVESVHEVLDKIQIFHFSPTGSDKNGTLAGTGKTFEKSANSPIALDFKMVTFTYPTVPSPALKAVTFTVAQGSFAALIGESGAGKSTTADLALGLLRPTEGNVTLNGTNAWDFRGQNPGALSYVSQGARLFAGSLLDNVTFGESPETANTDRVHDVLELVGLAQLVSELPNGLSTEIGVFESGLSGGQRQRVCIARALYGNPRFLVFDEATSSLDATSENRIARALLNLKNRTTLMVIAHRLSTIVHADQIFVLDRGELVASGTFDEVVQSHDKTRKNAELLGLI